MNICIVIPAFNEEMTIRTVVSDLVEYGFPIFVVDDGSSDGTAPISQEAGAQVISHEKNRGNGAALMTGLMRAFDTGYSAVLTLDADGAHRSQDIDSMLRTHIEGEANLTIGSRFINRAVEKIPSPKIDANRFAVNMFNLIFHSKQTDVASGFRILDKLAFDATPHESSFSWTFGCLAACLQSSLNVREAPIGVRYDAQELWATSQDELEDFLNFCSLMEPRLMCSIKTVKKIVNDKQICSVQVGKELLFIHPIPENRFVIFQRQNGWHGALKTSTAHIDFDKVLSAEQLG